MDSNLQITVIAEADEKHPYVVIDKPKGLASAPLTEEDKNNAYAQAQKLFPQLALVQGKKSCEHGLLHRLDTETDGLLLIAASQDFYDYMQIEQAQGRFIKYYTAICQKFQDNAETAGGFPPVPLEALRAQRSLASKQHITISSYFRHYGQGRKEVRPVTEDSGKAALKKLGKETQYSTEISIIENEFDNNKDFCKLECSIANGFKHQVRCHLAWIGLPVCGDPLYNFSGKKNAEKLMFSASKITFEYPRGDLNSYDRKDTWT